MPTTKKFIDFEVLITTHVEMVGLRRHEVSGLTGVGLTEAHRVIGQARAGVERWLHSQYKSARGYSRLLRLEEAVKGGGVFWQYIGATIRVYSYPTGALIGEVK
jgi:hypothetical protein